MSNHGNPKNHKLVSVGIPTYNRPGGLQKTIACVASQTYPEIEIIISDNCSSYPDVQKIISEFASKDSRVKIFRQSENIGLENNFNFVFSQSRAPYFIWMSDDDLFAPNYIEECVKFLEEKPDHVLCSGVAKYYAGNEFVFNEPMFRVDQKNAWTRLRKYFAGVQKNGNFYGVFRREVLSDAPLGHHVGCDWSFMGKLAVIGKLTYVDTTAYQRSAEGHSQSRKKMIQKFGYTGLKKIFFETYLAYLVSTNIFTDQIVRRRVNWLNRKLLVIMIFMQINWKLFFKFIKKIFGKKT